jgi:hypothetical protein
MKISVSWNMAPWSLVCWYQSFEGACCLHLRGSPRHNTLVWNFWSDVTKDSTLYANIQVSVSWFRLLLDRPSEGRDSKPLSPKQESGELITSTRSFIYVTLPITVFIGSWLCHGFSCGESSRCNCRWSSVKIFQNCCPVLTLGNRERPCAWSLPARINLRCQAQFTVQPNGASIE